MRIGTKQYGVMKLLQTGGHLVWAAICVFAHITFDSSTCQFSNWHQNDFLSATEYHSDAVYNSRRVGVVVVVVAVVHTFRNGLTFEHLDQFASYLEGSLLG